MRREKRKEGSLSPWLKLEMIPPVPWWRRYGPDLVVVGVLALAAIFIYVAMTGQ